jgi:hypothetical protein
MVKLRERDVREHSLKYVEDARRGLVSGELLRLTDVDMTEKEEKW